MKRRIVIISILVILFMTLSVFLILGANKVSEYSWIAQETAIREKELAYNEEIVATVNGVALKERELLRRVFNLETSYKIEVQRWDKMLANGLISKEYYEQNVENLRVQKVEIDIQEKIFKDMIEEEIYYQAAVQRGYEANDAEIRAFYEQAAENLPEEAKEIVTQYARGLGMNYGTYIEDIMFPSYKVKLSRGKMFTELMYKLRDKYPDENVDAYFLQNSQEYKELVSEIIENADVKLCKVVTK